MTQQEEWRPVVGYEGYYEVSSLGRVRSVDRVINQAAKCRSVATHLYEGKILKNHPFNKYGHQLVGLWRGGRRANGNIHRLVAEAFLGPCPAGMECCHNDGNPENNSVSNLRWDTHKNNSNDSSAHGTRIIGENHPDTSLTNFKVRIIKTILRDSKVYGVGVMLAKTFNVSPRVIARIRSGETWKSVTV